MTGEGPWERQGPTEEVRAWPDQTLGLEHEANSGWHLNDVPVALWGWGL